MSTLGNILSNAGQALQVHQKATQVAGHNINNSLTPGYSRQRAELATAFPLNTPYGTIGGGVRVADITRARDAILDVTVRQESSAAEGHRLRYELLGQIEADFVEFGDHGFGATLDAFWDAWSDLANYPGNTSTRLLVQSRGQQVASYLNRLAVGVESLYESGLERLQGAVSDLNRLAAEIADLNRQIISAEAGGGTAADLRDSRDLALDELARLTPIQVVERRNGGVGVMTGGITLVDDTVTRTIGATLIPPPGQVAVVRTDTGTGLDEEGGQIGALAKFLNSDVPGLRQELDNLARGLVESINTLHREGVARAIDPNTNAYATNIDFFHVGNGGIDEVRAINIRLSDAVAGNPDFIAVGGGGPNGEYLAGATEIALEIAGLRDRRHADGDPHLDNRSIAGYYQRIVVGLGAKITTAESSAAVHETLARGAEVRRESVSGVSTDEEMIKLIQAQTAYQAAAKVITTVDEMLQTVLNLI